MVDDYISLLERIKDNLRSEGSGRVSRLEIPSPDIVWVGNRTIIRNFRQIADVIGRDPQRMAVFMGKELATSANLDQEFRLILLGRKDRESIERVIQRYFKEYVICPVCGSPDTKLVKERKVTFLVCEACGARSPVREVK
ncbi:MAG TPA: translation initiation factor IF-2 subunit beta [Nitrososphaeria archaeon]|jgi:translation initiation factor 2 subunit 2|uniref:Translation initiation factor 2 subunit beta n=1 Tax=Conexivisphaera calida TaxID=1874277 RepID=A0A4P2VDY7_9ARCH|nr:translation initiation factor IF-2 subunit beta [Conexivisphaera calida]MDP7982917.1 translation initiation factor IF-2 subunit beta [Conexivisphaerales archaeon]PMP94337.1 MAG: translation initiation factor IF-2 subunit beta [Nitrososphaera sp.]BBE41613.1 Eukaryotic translation initiation factor 2 beta subunit [Conexivisphaera calida]HEU16767.1 translation initiation factor IF-2 subunit beta [Nitrososphaeria archaeon]